jgi:hypothetical protein
VSAAAMPSDGDQVLRLVRRLSMNDLRKSLEVFIAEWLARNLVEPITYDVSLGILDIEVDDNETSIEIDVARLADDLEIWLTNCGLRAATARERR